MRSLSFNATNATSAPLGEDPIYVLRVDWRTTGTRWYADRDLGLNNAEGRIIEIGDLAAQKKQDAVGSVGALAVVLDDSDGKLKVDFDANLVEGTTVYVYKGFESALATNDLIPLLKGVIVAPSWSEAERIVTFEIETRIHDLEVGYAIEQFFYDDLVPTTPMLASSAVGKAWPLCFGSVVHVPALKVLAPPETEVNGIFKRGDTSFLVADASAFPVDSPIDVIIDGMVFTVAVDKLNNRFNVLDANVPKYENIPFAARDGSDADVANPWVAWIGQDVNLANTFIYFTSEFGNLVYHRVLRQSGRKIWLDPMRIQRTKKKTGTGGYIYNSGFGTIPALLGPPTIILESAKFGRDGWGIQTSYAESSTAGNAQLGVASYKDTAQIISGVTWKFGAGQTVRLWSYPPGVGNRKVTYVANLIQSNVIKAIYAWRTNPSTGQRLLKALPSGTYQLNADTTLLGVDHVTTVTLNEPLSELYGQGWEDTIFVSLKSSVGPNPSDIISWLLTTYSNVAVDATTFAAVKTVLTNYPMGFARFNKENVIGLVENLAWQSRCALIQEDGTAKLKYLSVEPSVDLAIDEATIQSRTIAISFTLLEDIVSSFRSNWRQDYSGKLSREHTLVLTENVDKFGLIRREFDFFAYNVKSLVTKSTKFWAHRMANVWKLGKLNLLSRVALALEMFDCIHLQLADTSIFGGSYKTILDAHSMQSDDLEFGLSLWLPVVSGTNVQDPDAWLSDGGDTLPLDPVDILSETVFDEQFPDALSSSYSQTYISGHPAKIVSLDPNNKGAYLVDVFDDGYVDEDGVELPATNIDPAHPSLTIPLTAWPTDVALALDRGLPTTGIFGQTKSFSLELEEGTKVSIYNVTGQRWMFNVPADKATAVGKVTRTPASPGLVDLYLKGFDKPPTKTDVEFFPVDTDNPPVVGDKVFLHKRGDVIYAQAMSSKLFWARITTTGSQDYGFQEIDPSTGTDVVPGIAGTARNVPGSTLILPSERVPVYTRSGAYFIWYPLADCPTS